MRLKKHTPWRQHPLAPLGGVAGLLGVALLAGCPEPPKEEPAVYAAPTLQEFKPVDEVGSCISCHPRQFQEWLGSSHNYGSGLDGTYQSLEITGNYFAAHALGRPVFRQNALCISCHAPTAASFVNTKSADTLVDSSQREECKPGEENCVEGYLDTNRAIREQFRRQPELSREIERPKEIGSSDPVANPPESVYDVDLLPPGGRALEFQLSKSPDLDGQAADANSVRADRERERALISFQGITCDACHKVGRPLDDRTDYIFRDPDPPNLYVTKFTDGYVDVASLQDCNADEANSCGEGKICQRMAGRKAEGKCVEPYRCADPNLSPQEVQECMNDLPSAEERYERCMEIQGPGEVGLYDDPTCRRLAFNQNGLNDRNNVSGREGKPYFDFGISNYALVVEREGDVRFGPFFAPGQEEGGDGYNQNNEGPAAAAVGHNVSAGRKVTLPNGQVVDYAQYNVAVYPDGEPFPDQPEDKRPYLQTGQFCSACHDVRLVPLYGADPIHAEPFYRLENLSTEWFTSSLNLYPTHQGDSEDPREQFKDNPYRHEDGSARRLVCQDCHMSLYPYAPPGTFPGAYTHPNDCDETGKCGLLAATKTFMDENGEEQLTTRGNVRPSMRARLTTHNMTGPDIALGMLAPLDESLLTEDGTPKPSLTLPVQTGRDGLEDRAVFSGEVDDMVYGLPMDVDRRRQRLVGTVVTTSLAGTPEKLDVSPDNCDMREMIQYEHDGVVDMIPNPEYGHCNLPIKAWTMNVNGGHNLAAGFSQERQIWIELTVEDMGRPIPGKPGLYEIVDCHEANLDDFYESAADSNGDGFPERAVKRHTTDGAIDVFNRMFGTVPGQKPDTHGDHERLCRGLSGHLIDKPHDETHEPEADGVLDDEDIMLHRVGNTLPVLVDDEKCEAEAGGADANGNGYPDSCETELISWHVADVGFDYGERFCSNGSAKPCSPNMKDELEFYPTKADLDAAKADVKKFSDRVARADQLHGVGQDAFDADLTSYYMRMERGSRQSLGVANSTKMGDMPFLTRDGRYVTPREVGSHLTRSATQTPDERTEMLYPFPEFPGLVRRKEDGETVLGNRSGLAYMTNVFYHITGCSAGEGNPGECVGPENLPFKWNGQTYNLKAQMPWPMTYPGLPHLPAEDDVLGDDAGDEDYAHGQFHFVFEESVHSGHDEHGYVALLKSLGEWQQQEKARNPRYNPQNQITEHGTPYGEVFTFVPFNANHFPNNRSLVFYKPQRHYWDIRVNPEEVVGPIRVHIRAWYRHFPPEFLRLMTRFTEGTYLRAVAEGKACPHNDPNCIPKEENWYPYGPLVVEGEMTKLFPNAPSVNNLRRVMLYESVMHVQVHDDKPAGGVFPDPVANPTKEDVQRVFASHCNQCHLDVLRHGNLVLAYDAFPQWDVPGGQSKDTVQDWTENVVNVPSRYANGQMIVKPGSPEESTLYTTIVASQEEFEAQKLNDESNKSRPMPLKFDRMSQAEIDIIKNWIAQGAR